MGVWFTIYGVSEMQNLGRENLKWGAVVGEMEIGVRMEARGNFKYTRMKRYLCISWNIPLFVFQVKPFFVCDVLVRVKASSGEVRKCFFSLTKVLFCCYSNDVVCGPELSVLLIIYFHSSKKKKHLVLDHVGMQLWKIWLTGNFNKG